MLPLTGDHSENTIGCGLSPTVFSVRASPPDDIALKDVLTAFRHSSFAASLKKAGVFLIEDVKKPLAAFHDIILRMSMP